MCNVNLNKGKATGKNIREKSEDYSEIINLWAPDIYSLLLSDCEQLHSTKDKILKSILYAQDLLYNNTC